MYPLGYTPSMHVYWYYCFSYTKVNTRVLRKIETWNPFIWMVLYTYIWQCVKTLYPCSSHQNSWVKMDVHPTKNAINRYWSIPIFYTCPKSPPPWRWNIAPPGGALTHWLPTEGARASIKYLGNGQKHLVKRHISWGLEPIQDPRYSKIQSSWATESLESFSFRPISCTKSCGHWGPIKVLFGWNTGNKKLHYLGLRQWLTRTERFSHAILGGKSMGVSRKLSLEPMGNRGQVTGYWSSWLEANAWPSWLWHPLYFWVLSPFGQTKTPKMYCQANQLHGCSKQRPNSSWKLPLFYPCNYLPVNSRRYRRPTICIQLWIIVPGNPWISTSWTSWSYNLHRPHWLLHR